jgi:hypothetical protein
MATIKLFLGIVLFAFAGGYRMFNSALLTGNTTQLTNKAEVETRQRIVKTAEAEVGVREQTNNNDGARVEEYLRTVGLRKPEPYCAAFVSWVFARNGLAAPRSGWSPDLFPYARLARSALPANILGIYFADRKRIAHVGLIVSSSDDWVNSVEANTNVEGSREGSGVYRKKRHRKTIYRIADWIAEKGGLK